MAMSPDARDGHADRDRDRLVDAQAGRMEAHDRAADALTDLDGLLGGRAPQEDRELLAAVAGRRVLGAHARAMAPATARSTRSPVA